MGTSAVKPRRLRDAIRHPRWIVTFAVLAAVVVTLIATVPVPRATHFSLETTGCGGGRTGCLSFSYGWSQSLCPTGARVGIAFSSDVLASTFGVLAPNGTLIWSGHSASYANASFVVPTCGTYQIFVSGFPGTYTAEGTISYSSPLL